MGTWGRREWLSTYRFGFCTSLSCRALWQKDATGRGLPHTAHALRRAEHRGAPSCASSSISGCTGGGVGARRAAQKAVWQFQKTVDRHLRYLAFTVSVLLLCMKKALRQRSIEERTRDYFYYDYCYYFAQLHRGQNLGTFCKEKFVSLFLWPN